MTVSWLVKIRTPIDDQQSARDQLDHVVVLADPFRHREELVDRKRGEQERDTKPERVDGEQQHPFADGFLRAGDDENPPEDRTDARRPAEREGDPDEQRAQRPAGFFLACMRFSVSSAAMRNTPIVCRPKITMTAPATLASTGLFASRNLPSALAEAPSAVNTSEKPSTKASDVTSTWRRDARTWPRCRRASRPATRRRRTRRTPGSAEGRRER